MHDDDNRLATLMIRATATMEPSPDLATAALARGKRLRRRRVGIQVGSTLVVCALAATIGAAVLPSSPHTPTQRVGSGTTVAAPPRAKDLIKHGPLQVDLLRTFIDLAPSNAKITRRDGATFASSADVVVTYDDGHGAVEMAVSVMYPSSGGGLGGACVNSTCTHPRPGATLAIYDGFNRTYHPSTKSHETHAILEYKDHFTVSVYEWNALDEADPTSVTRPHVPLTIAQLKAIVSSPMWRN